jgi:hypothetical protein
MFYNKFQKFAKRMADEGDDGGGSSGAGAGSAGSTPDTQAQIELLTKTVGVLADGLQKMEGSHNQVLEALAKISGQSQAHVEEKAEAHFGDDVDLSQLDRKQFAALIIDSVRKATQSEISKVSGTLNGNVQELASRFESKNASEQVAKAAETHADFWEWSGEIKQMLKENPTLSVVRAYNLARAEDTKKATALDKKYNPPKEKGGSPFFALTPTSSIGSKDTRGKMNQKEAAENAFDSVMNTLGDKLQSSNLKIA